MVFDRLGQKLQGWGPEGSVKSLAIISNVLRGLAIVLYALIKLYREVISHLDKNWGTKQNRFSA